MKTPPKINLANIPTPIQKIQFRESFFFIKRDDFTGLELTGNKVRKLEYLIPDAIKNKCTTLFTCGGVQSNHARATAIAGISNKLNVELFLRGKERKTADGNLMINKLANIKIHFLSSGEYHNVNEIMEKERKLLAAKGTNTYIIPEGGSSPLGIFGYFDAVREIIEQIDLSKIHGILTAAGSGGTAAGLLAGIAYYNLKIKVFAVNVLLTGGEMRDKILGLAEEFIDFFKLKIKLKYDQLVVIDRYSAEGYDKITTDKLDLIKSFFQETGILFDPVYTGKAFNAYHKEILKNKKQSKVLFLHTGGFLGIFPKKGRYLDT